MVMHGQKIGYWTVQNSSIIAPSGERKWLCRCVCGTERYVLERSLIYNTSSSCGCINRTKAREKIEHNLLGKQFEDLKVLAKAEKKARNGGTWWKCECSCGKLIEVSGTLLVTGKKTSCGCKTIKNYYKQDIKEQTFGRLTAKYPLEKRDGKGGVIWHCECSCGNEVDYPYNWLVYSNIRSCGCQKKENDNVIQQFLTRVDGTSLDMIKSKKIPKGNTTGVKGVYFIKGKWVAKIVFQRKQYQLGTFKNIEDAIKARQEAESRIFGTVIAHYEKWETKARNNPQWAEENPVRIDVKKDNIGEIQVVCTPNL